MDDRTWIWDTLAHREPAAVPYNFMLSPPAQEALERHYGSQALEETLGLPIRMNAPASVKPLYADPGTFGDTVRDEFGVVWSTSRIDRGAPLQPCLPEADLAGYRFPNPAEEYRFAALGEWCRRNRDHFMLQTLTATTPPTSA
jgi:hypothetical protein